MHPLPTKFMEGNGYPRKRNFRKGRGTVARKGNWLILLCLGAALYGLALIWSATRYDPDLHSLPMKQAVALGAGVVLCLILRVLPVRAIIEKGWWVLAAGNVGLLLLLIPFGNDDGTGNKSWLALPGGVFNLQPGEVAKVGFLLLLAFQLTHLEQRGLNRPKSIFLLTAHVLALCGLVWVVSGDLGMVTVYLGIWFVMLWSAGVHPLWLLGEVAAGVGAVLLLWPRLPEYVRMRFLVVWDHDLDPLGKGFQQERSLLAVGSGQVTGQGYLQGTQTQSTSASSLPARHTDFIFSVAGEELGLLGCLAILLLLFGIVAGCMALALRKEDRLLSLTAMGVAGMVGVQTILNVGMCLYAAPVIGVTLPFFSYGGSSLLASFGAVGILLSLAGERKKLTG